jgi:hypothetical protein
MAPGYWMRNSRGMGKAYRHTRAVSIVRTDTNGTCTRWKTGSAPNADLLPAYGFYPILYAPPYGLDPRKTQCLQGSLRVYG